MFYKPLINSTGNPVATVIGITLKGIKIKLLTGIVIFSMAQLGGGWASHALAALIMYQHTFENTSGIDPNDFQFTTTNNDFVRMEVYNRTPMGNLGFKISKDPPAGTYPTKSLDLAIVKPATNKVYVQIIAPEGTRYDPEKTFFTFDGEEIRTRSLTLAPDLKNLGGDNWSVVLTNTNDEPITISSLTYGINDPNNPYAGGYVPGGTLVSITPPDTPLMPGASLLTFFTGDPKLTVSFSVEFTASSEPSNPFLDIVAMRISEPPSLTIFGLAFLLLGVWQFGRMHRRS
jgi:hypothetical protein